MRAGRSPARRAIADVSRETQVQPPDALLSNHALSSRPHQCPFCLRCGWCVFMIGYCSVRSRSAGVTPDSRKHEDVERRFIDRGSTRAGGGGCICDGATIAAASRRMRRVDAWALRVAQKSGATGTGSVLGRSKNLLVVFHVKQTLVALLPLGGEVSARTLAYSALLLVPPPIAVDELAHRDDALSQCTERCPSESFT